MSTPTTLALPAEVEATTVRTSRGAFAAHVARVPSAVGHVLLVPGWTGSKEDFTPVLPLLAAAGLDVTAFDQRGQFETPGTEDDDYSLEGLAADATSVAAAVSADPVHVLGHSFGGLVAQAAVAADPDQWRSLSLLCTGPGALGESPTRPLRRLVEALDTVPLEQLHALRESAVGIRRPPEVAAFLERRFTSNAVPSLRAMTLHLTDAPDRVDAVVATGVPVWVGRGERDDAWPHGVQDEMARRYGTSVHVVPDTAHSPAVEGPEALVDRWLPFLLEPGRSS